jgi:hypothetical protein
VPGAGLNDELPPEPVAVRLIVQVFPLLVSVTVVERVDVPCASVNLMELAVDPLARLEVRPVLDVALQVQTTGSLAVTVKVAPTPPVSLSVRE